MGRSFEGRRRATEAQRERLRAAIDEFLELSDDPDTPVGFEVWIDGDDQIRRMIQSGIFPIERGEPPAKMTIRMDLTELGTPIALKAPPAGEVLDVTEAVGKAAREITATE